MKWLENYRYKFLLILGLFFVCTVRVMAQSATVKGTVTNSKSGKSLPGVNIKVKGTTTGTTTNAKGKYSLSVPSPQDTLVFSYIGYKTKTVPINGRSTINVALKSTTLQGQQMVVVGYGKQSKAELTGAVSTVSGSKLQKAPTVNISNSLEGQMPGVIVNTRSGKPGASSSQIDIRGEGTLNNNSPLVVIDGAPSTMQVFDRLNPADIKNISVLKDAAAAIYGAEAANGVILVTTKQGKAGTPTVTYDGSFGYNQPTRIPSMVNGWQYMKYENEKDKYYGRSPEYTQKQINALKNGTYNKRRYANTDWEHAVIKQFSPMTTHRLQISGGSKEVTYLLSGQYQYQDGIYHHSASYYHQGNIRANFTVHATKNLKISLKANEIIQNRHAPNQNTLGGGGIWANVMAEYPFLPVYYPNGGLSGTAALVNPMAIATGKNGTIVHKRYTTHGILSFKLNLPGITKGLYLRGQASDMVKHHDSRNFHDRFNEYSYDPTTDSYVNTRSQEPPLSLNQRMDKMFYSDYNMKLGYKRNFGPNNITAFVAYEQSSFKHNWFWASRTGFLSDKLVQLNFGSSKQLNNGGSANHYTDQRLPNGDYVVKGGLKDIFGRLTYNYKKKYLINFSLRHDGSFRFPPGHRWGTFPAVSVGWRISQEPFFKNNVGFISELKLKASWGRMGNDQIAPYQYLRTYHFGSGAIFGPNQSHYKGFVSGVAPNPNITWEVADKKNIGINVGFLNGLLSLNADYFFSKRNNILVHPNANVPSYTGISLPDENIGKVNNHGVDASFSLQNRSKAFNYKLSGNFTFARNKIVNMAEPKNVPAWQKQTGHPMNSWLLYKANGIYKNQKQINNSPHLPGTQPGDIRYVDVNGDGQINANDMVRIYQSATPEIQYGFTMAGGYKGLQLSVFWQGQAKAKQMVLPNAQNKQFVPPTWVYKNRWTPSHPNASLPHAFDRESSINNRPSTLWLKDAWFLRLKTVRLSYSFPVKLVNKFDLNKLQLYVTGQNLYVISKIKHYDPELNSSLGEYYPQIRIFKGGISLSF